jgi:hypothetical protein
MKNWIGLLIALSLAIVACLLNWQYLERKSKEIEVISFLAIADDVKVKTGDSFSESHFTRLEIPRKNAGSLKETAVLYGDMQTVVSMKALHDYRGGEIVLRQELKTPPVEFKLGNNELAMWVPVSSATFVSSLVKPGDEVSFVVPSPDAVFRDIQEPENPNDQLGPEFGNTEDIDEPRRQVFNRNTELVGPFRVLSLGNRLGSYEVSVASGAPKARENVIGIAVTRVGLKIDPKAEKLVRWMAQPNFRQAGVVLHPRAAEE